MDFNFVIPNTKSFKKTLAKVNALLSWNHGPFDIEEISFTNTNVVLTLYVAKQLKHYTYIIGLKVNPYFSKKHKSILHRNIHEYRAELLHKEDGSYCCRIFRPEKTQLDKINELLATVNTI